MHAFCRRKNQEKNILFERKNKFRSFKDLSLRVFSSSNFIPLQSTTMRSMHFCEKKKKSTSTEVFIFDQPTTHQETEFPGVPLFGRHVFVGGGCTLEYCFFLPKLRPVSQQGGCSRSRLLCFFSPTKET